jgi:hypothetical protein
MFLQNINLQWWQETISGWEIATPSYISGQVPAPVHRIVHRIVHVPALEAIRVQVHNESESLYNT